MAAPPPSESSPRQAVPSSKKTTLVLVRHGKTVWNQEERFQGQQDSALLPEGERGARLLGARVKSDRALANITVSLFPFSLT
jgi:broad specificity phosphatase PhoE